MRWRQPITLSFVMYGTTAGLLGAQATEETAVRQVVEAIASHSQVSDIAGLDTVFAPDAWVEVIEGSGVNHGWADYRDNHLRPELAEMRDLHYRFFDVRPQVRGNVAWASFRYDLAADGARGHAEAEGRGTAILERRGGRWLVVHLHTSGRRKAPGG